MFAVWVILGSRMPQLEQKYWSGVVSGSVSSAEKTAMGNTRGASSERGLKIGFMETCTDVIFFLAEASLDLFSDF